MRTLLFVVAIVLLAACAQQPLGDPPPDPDLELVLNRSSVEVLRGGSGDVTVTLERLGGANDPASLALATPLPTGVTATFDPPELIGAQLTSKLTVSAEATAADVTLDLEVTVVSGELTDLAPLEVTVAGLDVVGRIEDMYGQPMRGGRAGAQGQTVAVGADGTFTLHDLSVPYDLMLGSGPEGRLHLFEGMTAEQPFLVPFGRRDGPIGDSSVAVEGMLVDGAPLLPGERVFVCVEGHKVVIRVCGFSTTGDVAYIFAPTWFGDPEQPVTLHALHFEVDADEVVTGYLGYDSLDVDFVVGETVVWDIEFERVGSTLMTGSIEQGTGITGGGLVALGAVRVSKTLSMVVNGAGNQTDFSILMPDLPARSPIFDLIAVDGFGTPSTSIAWRSETGPKVGDVTLRDMPSVAGPPNGEIGVSLSTPFAVEGLEGQVKTFFWQPVNGTGPMIALTTKRDEVTIPDPAVIGLGTMLSSWYEMEWTVTGYNAADVDGSAAEYGQLAALLKAAVLAGPVPLGEGAYAQPEMGWFYFGTPP